MGINRRAEKLKQMINQTNTEDRTEILKAQYGNLWKKIKKSIKRDKRIWIEHQANKAETATSIHD
jgi:hypothetical protein